MLYPSAALWFLISCIVQVHSPLEMGWHSWSLKLHFWEWTFCWEEHFLLGGVVRFTCILGLLYSRIPLLWVTGMILWRRRLLSLETSSYWLPVSVRDLCSCFCSYVWLLWIHCWCSILWVVSGSRPQRFIFRLNFSLYRCFGCDAGTISHSQSFARVVWCFVVIDKLV